MCLRTAADRQAAHHTEHATLLIVGHHRQWTEFWGAISLSREEAHALAEDLAAVVDRYREMEGGPIDVVVHAGAVSAATRTRRRRTAAR